MKSFLANPITGLFLLATGIALAGGGVAALMGQTRAAIWMLFLTSFVAAICAIAGACIGAARHPVIVLAAVVLMPLVAFPAYYAIGTLRLTDGGLSWFFVGIGLVAVGLSGLSLIGSSESRTAAVS